MLLVITSTTALLIVEYRNLHNYVTNIIDLKKEYRSYINAAKQAIHHHRIKTTVQSTPDASSAGSTSDTDTNDTSEDYSLNAPLEIHADEDNDFTPINRDANYLRESTIAFMHSQNAASLIRQLDPDLWQDYTGLSTSTLPSKKAPKKIPRKNTKKTSQPLFQSAYDQKIAKDFKLTWPINRSDFWLSSFFGRRKHNGTWGFHYGIDMAALKGTPVRAAAPGKVVEAGRNNGYGNTVVIAHSSKYKTRYAHLQHITVKIGQTVEEGTRVGSVGDTGFVRKSGKDASHLHFELYAFGKQINPIYYLQ